MLKCKMRNKYAHIIATEILSKVHIFTFSATRLNTVSHLIEIKTSHIKSICLCTEEFPSFIIVIIWFSKLFASISFLLYKMFLMYSQKKSDIKLDLHGYQGIVP